jgi:nucleotide-binding universal stress UspA family protein
VALPQVASRTAFSTLLVPTDLSPRSRKALSCAVSLARTSNAKILLAHVVNPERWHLVPPDEMHPALCHDRRITEKKLVRLLKSEDLKGIRTDAVIKQGDFRQVLCNIAHEQHADLVVAATHGRKGVSKLLFGSKIEEVCHRAPCPILLVGPKSKAQQQARFERVLFTTDLSAISLGALPLILAFAAEHGSRLRVARIVTEDEKKGSGGNAEFMLAQVKNEILPTVTARASLAHEPEFVVEFGSALTTILRIASEWKADLIGMGAHRPGTLAVYLPGDLAYEVACEAQCPVLTIVD